MTKITTTRRVPQSPSLETAWQDVDSSFGRFCLTAGIEAIEQMLGGDAERIAGARHGRGGGRAEISTRNVFTSASSLMAARRK